LFYGFTLVELLVVVAIIAILSALLLSAMLLQRQRDKCSMYVQYAPAADGVVDV
jgi:prepilin-type N-terminal cleavage/methylation domain-containing protein